MYLPDECEHGVSILMDCNACEPILDPIDYGCEPFDSSEMEVYA